MRKALQANAKSKMVASGQRKAASASKYQIKSAGPRKSPGGMVVRNGSKYSTRTGQLIGGASTGKNPAKASSAGPADLRDYAGNPGDFLKSYFTGGILGPSKKK